MTFERDTGPHYKESAILRYLKVYQMATHEGGAVEEKKTASRILQKMRAESPGLHEDAMRWAAQQERREARKRGEAPPQAPRRGAAAFGGFLDPESFAAPPGAGWRERAAAWGAQKIAAWAEDALSGIDLEDIFADYGEGEEDGDGLWDPEWSPDWQNPIRGRFATRIQRAVLVDSIDVYSKDDADADAAADHDRLLVCMSMPLDLVGQIEAQAQKRGADSAAARQQLWMAFGRVIYDQIADLLEDIEDDDGDG